MATAIVWLLGVYLSLGFVFAVWFLAQGIGRLDPAARSAGLSFRLIIAPGVAALWPVLLAKVLGAASRGGTHGPGVPEDHA